MTSAGQSIIDQIDEIRKNMAAGGKIGIDHNNAASEIFGKDLIYNDDIESFVVHGFQAAERHGNTYLAQYAVAVNFMRMGYVAAMAELASKEKAQ